MATATSRNKRRGDAATGGDMGERAESGKRRRGDGRKQMLTQVVEEEKVVAEGELEAFFAILRRIKEFASGDGRRWQRAPEEKKIQARMWRPTFVWEDFEGAKSGTRGDDERRRRWRESGEVEEEEETAAGEELRERFDLNVTPANEPILSGQN